MPPLADFTKQYNRLRQHAAVYNGTASASKSTQGQAVVSLPAVNKPRKSKPDPSASTTSSLAKPQPVAIATDQLALLQKYNARLQRISEPHVGLNMGAGVNRKGPSATANKKDKADRATTEQVLDPRTRLILYKMIGRGVLFEVNGCISTGKEVSSANAVTVPNDCLPSSRRLMFITPWIQAKSTWQSKSTRHPYWSSKIVIATLLASTASDEAIPGITHGRWYVSGPRRRCGT